MMDVCVLCFTVLLWKTTTSSGEPEVRATRDHVVQMGRNLRAVPYGNPEIKSINFGYNHIEYLPAYIFYFNNYRYLNKIELSQNRISNISNKAFRELKMLKLVDLSGNNLSYLDTGTFKSNNRLEKLDLSNNLISFQYNKPFLNSPSLESLILSDNRIEQIHEITFVKLPKLRNLIMANNMIFIIEPKSFAPLKLLQYLSLSNTGVDRLNMNMFRDNVTLPRLIDLNDTPLSNKFNPRLRKVKNEAIGFLLNVDNYF